VRPQSEWDEVQRLIEGEGEGDFLASPEGELDTAAVREQKRDREQLRQFVDRFPFDVINLDLEEYVFKPSERLPGKLLKALRRVLIWQQRPVRISTNNQKFLDGFDDILRDAATLIPMSEPHVILIGEYIPENFLLSRQGNKWDWSGLFDFGDVAGMPEGARFTSSTVPASR